MVHQVSQKAVNIGAATGTTYVLVQADANDGPWTGPDGPERWQPLSWMGSAYRAVSDPTVHFAYAVNPFMVGNLSDIPFDGQTAILERGRRGGGAPLRDAHQAVAAGDDAPDRLAGLGVGLKRGVLHALHRLEAARRRDGRSLIYSADYRAMDSLVSYLMENCCAGAECARAAAASRA